MKKPAGLLSFLLLCLLILILPMNSFSLDGEKFLTDYLWQKTARLPLSKRPKIALVLGGGGARGLAHIGVLKVLKENNVPIDIIVGTSVGAIVGSLYSAGVPIEKIEKMGQNIGWNDVADLTATGVIKLMVAESLLSTEKMEKYLRENIGSKRFDELDIQFACLATDLVTGERIIFREGDVALAARASATMPGIFVPVEYRHRYLVDGGLFDNIPTDVAKLLGADIIIAVPVSADFSKNNISNVYMVLTQAIYIQGRLFDSEKLKSADFIIAPSVSQISTVDLGKSAECIDAGITAAHLAMPKLKQLLINRTSAQYLFE
ncbi:MAG TPA: esterase [Elusimicrobia bacterium]|nr:esterase [Elusimicrobiota bacterium]